MATRETGLFYREIERLQKNGESNRAFSSRLGFDPNLLCDWKRGVEPKPATIRRLCLHNGWPQARFEHLLRVTNDEWVTEADLLAINPLDLQIEDLQLLWSRLNSLLLFRQTRKPKIVFARFTEIVRLLSSRMEKKGDSVSARVLRKMVDEQREVLKPPPKQTASLKKGRGETLKSGIILALAILFCGDPSFAVDIGVVHSIENLNKAVMDLGDTTENLNRADRTTRWKGVFAYCVCKRDRNSIIYATDTTDTEYSARFVIDHLKHAARNRCGECYSPPKVRFVTYGRKGAARRRAKANTRLRRNVPNRSKRRHSAEGRLIAPH